MSEAELQQAVAELRRSFDTTTNFARANLMNACLEMI